MLSWTESLHTQLMIRGVVAPRIGRRFIASAAFSEGLINAAKLGILLVSAVAATAGVGVLAWLSSRPVGSHDNFRDAVGQEES